MGAKEFISRYNDDMDFTIAMGELMKSNIGLYQAVLEELARGNYSVKLLSGFGG